MIIKIEDTYDNKKVPLLIKQGTYAEREGFEPSVASITLRRFSKPLPSATRPSLLQATNLKVLRKNTSFSTDMVIYSHFYS